MLQKRFRFFIDNGGNFALDINFEKEDIKNINFFQTYFKDLLIEKTQELKVSLENLYIDFYNHYKMKSILSDIKLYQSFLDELNTEFNKNIFFPQKVLGLNIFEQKEIEVYRSEFSYRTYQSFNIYKRFKYNFDIINNPLLKEIIDGNSKNITHLKKEHIEYLQELFTHSIFYPKQQIKFDENFENITFDKYNTIIKNLKVNEEYFSSDLLKFSLKKSRFYNEFETNYLAYIIEDTNGNRIIYDKDIIFIYNVNTKIEQNFIISNYGEFIFLIDRFNLLFEENAFIFPKYEYIKQ